MSEVSEKTSVFGYDYMRVLYEEVVFMEGTYNGQYHTLPSQISGHRTFKGLRRLVLLSIIGSLIVEFLRLAQILYTYPENENS